MRSGPASRRGLFFAPAHTLQFKGVTGGGAFEEESAMTTQKNQMIANLRGRLMDGSFLILLAALLILAATYA